MEKPQRRIKRGWMNLRVDAIKTETHDTKTFYLVDAEAGGRQFDYTAGQYLTFRFDTLAAKPLVRSYTMSSAPCEADNVSVTIKQVADPFVSKYFVQDVKVGDILKARGPIGKFCYFGEEDQDHLVMVAAGSGVTPFISMLKDYAFRLHQYDHPKKMTLLVTFRTKADLICWETLTEVRDIPGVNIVVSLSREDATAEGFWKGRVDAAMLDRLMDGNFTNATYMSCGPSAIMDLMDTHMASRGVEKKNVKSEAFD